MIRLTSIVLFATLLIAGAEDGTLPTDEGEFRKGIQPLLTELCSDCHGEKKQKAEFFLHDIDGSITGGKDTVRWEKILEMISLGDMPPEEKPQLSKLERAQVTTWIATELRKIGRGQDEGKLALPHQANRIDHEALFSGEHQGPAYSPARLWRKNPHIYDRFARELRTKISQPFLGLGGKGIQDYATLFADEATIKTMLRNSNLIAESMVSKQRSHVNRHLNVLFKEGAEPTEEQIESAITDLFRLIFYRDPSSEDRERYIDGLFKMNRDLGGLKLGMRSLITAMLMSQEFVYRMEIGLGEALPSGRRMLSADEIAYALSFALYDKPDPSLLKAAADGKLATREDVARETRRILEIEDERKQYWNYPMYHRWGEDYYHQRPRVLRFFQEFFGYTAVVDVFKDQQRNGDHHANRLRKDADMLVLAILERDQDVLAELLTTNEYPMDYSNQDRLKNLLESKNKKSLEHMQRKYGDQFAEIAKDGRWPGIDTRHVSAYNLDRRRADAIRRAPGEFVKLPENQRAGMLTHPAWLVAHSGNFDNDPIRRGKWIREHLLADLVPEVPIGVDAKVPDDPHRTLRERLDVVRAEQCWRCHKKMNPLGEAFESFDDFGRFREQIVLGDADAYFKAKRQYDGQKENWQKELKDWRSYDAGERAAKIVAAEQVLAGLKPPEERIENYPAAKRHYESDVKRWNSEIKRWSELTDAEQQRRIKDLEHRLAAQIAPKPESKPVDSSGELRGTGDPTLDGPVNGAIDLSRRLARSDRARQSFIRHAFRYWMGRNETLDDSPTLIAADHAYVENGGSFKAMLISLLSSDSFLYRKDPTTNGH
ncbi:MAG: hypothetical protein ACI9UA_004765 [Pseudoalteromonas tetraodonis]